MKALIVTLLVMIQVSLNAQSIPVTARFVREEYRLFIYGRNTVRTHPATAVDKTDQIYYAKHLGDSVFVFESKALKFVCNTKKHTAEVYFDKHYDDTYPINLWDCYSYFVVEFPQAKATYYFYRLYAADRAW